VQTQWGQREFNTLADFTSTILGLTGTPAVQLAVLAGTKIAVNDTFSATEDAMLLSPSPHKVYELVIQKQAKLKTDFDQLGATASSDFDASADYIRRYAYICTPAGIHQIVDEAIQAQAASQSTDPNQNVGLAESLKELADGLNNVNLGGTNKVSTLDANDVAYLYRVFTLSPPNKDLTGATPDVQAYLQRKPELFARANAIYKDAAQRTSFIALLARAVTSAPQIANMAAIVGLTPAHVVTQDDLLTNALFTTVDGKLLKITVGKDNSGNVTYVILTSGAGDSAPTTASASDVLKNISAPYGGN